MKNKPDIHPLFLAFCNLTPFERFWLQIKYGRKEQNCGIVSVSEKICGILEEWKRSAPLPRFNPMPGESDGESETEL